MSQISDNNKKIAKNTIFIYFRIFTTMIIGLYSSRIVLQVLGISDFGIFSVVGGVLAMFTFITASLGTATSRFFNVEMGKENGDVNKIFNVNHYCRRCDKCGNCTKCVCNFCKCSKDKGSN